MKIGIISINSHTKVLNFASPLHTMAFQQFLNEYGYKDNIIIDYKPCYYKEFDARHPYNHYKLHPHKNEKKQKNILKKWKELYVEREHRFDKFQAFIDKWYKQTDICYTPKKLDEVDPCCDIYMCVTDVIWKYNPNNGFDKGFFLAGKYMQGKGKIAYSASRGAKGYTEEQSAYFRELVSSFDYISVREKSLCDYINTEISQHASLVLDPVFLQERKFYDDLAVEPKERGYVLIYIVMEKTKELVVEAVEFAESRGLKVIELSEDMENRFIPKGTTHDVIYDIGIEEWLGYMKNADYIFTNSFHCCAFSIIFNKQFYAGPRAGDKVDWVLELFELTGRRVLTGRNNFSSEIDYKKVENLRIKYKQISKNYILNAIDNVELSIKNPIKGKVVNFLKKPKGIRLPLGRKSKIKNEIILKIKERLVK